MSEHTTSNPIKILDALWNQPRGSWSRLNRTMRRGLFLAVEAKLEFLPGDFERIEGAYRWGRWIGADGIEDLYAKACETPNPSAWKALERHLKRKPILYLSKRLHVGSEVVWKGLSATVTFMDSAGRHFVACGYDHRVSNKPNRVVKITREEMVASEKARRASERAQASVGSAP